jgi:hypothetical protein
VEDPWFHADTLVNNTNGIPSFGSSPGLSVLGCVERYQVCIDNPCSGFTGYYNMMQSNLTIPSSAQKPTQNAIFQLMWKAIWASQTKYLVTLLNQNILLANNYLCKLVKKFISFFKPRLSRVPISFSNIALPSMLQ